MGLRLYNTLRRQVEPFEPLEPGGVRLYSCGPTVYGPSHIGNFRSYIFADVLRRYLAWSGYRVTWVMNITDVDDRIIRNATEAGLSIDELTGPHVATLAQDLGRLRIGPPDEMPRATEHVPDMARLISRLLERGHAYRTEDGSIFFRIDSWPAYGRLARLDPAQQRVGERVEADDYGKDDVRDFALWKAPKPGEPSWSTEVGEGRPGWHIECSAMSMRYLGDSFDLHTGGVDLIFPHHEDEIAQSEAATRRPFVRTWLHCAHLQMGGQKMARRDGNVARPADLYAQGFVPRALRFALLRVHYRAPIEFTDEALSDAAAAVTRLSTALAALDAYREDRPTDASLDDLLASTRERFGAAMDDDLNVSAALATVFDLVKEINRRLEERQLSTADAERTAAFIRDLDQVLAVAEDEDAELEEADRLLLDERAAAREARQWDRADELRAALRQHGVLVEDTRDGQRWRLATVEKRVCTPEPAGG
ncbi:MAG: cysteine--tRNA ligase [Chloroflexi bacterium]|nr:cysteine--tRNA ligase [Chloroflexota bacterium]